MRFFVIGGVACDKIEPGFTEQSALLERTCHRLGGAIRAAGHAAILCSVFSGSADIDVLRGMASAVTDRPLDIDLHYPDGPDVRSRVEEVVRELHLIGLRRYPHPPPQADTQEAWAYAWLLCQLHALDECHVVVALGGKTDRTASLLLLLAEGRRKSILPATFLGGAAEQAYYRRRYELEDRFGEKLAILRTPDSIENIVQLAEQIATSGERNRRIAGPLRFFISYPRARPAEADHVEMILRRRNMMVYRDETEFGAGHEIPAEITEALHAADVFVALWCQEYACSPWCFDELEQALERRSRGKIELWMLCIDETRMVPRGARDLIRYSIRSREELEGRVLGLLDQLVASRSAI